MDGSAELRRELQALRREVDELRAELAAVRTAPVAVARPLVGADAAPASAAVPPGRDVDRRAVLRLAGAGAAAAGAVAAGGLAGAPPAAAANGQALYLGVSNTASNYTPLQDTGSTPKNVHVFYVTDNGTISSTSYAAAVGGLATNSTISNGVYGGTTNPNGYGLIGQVLGLSGGSGAAIRGIGGGIAKGVTATGYVGVEGVGIGPGSVGVSGSGDVGVVGAGTVANARLTASGASGPARGSGTAGDVVCDSNGDLWFCPVSGVWRRLSGNATAGSLVVLPTTQRIYDSRSGFQPTNVQKGALSGGVARTIAANYGGFVPAGATAVLVNVTVAGTGPAGFVSLYRNGIGWPGTSTLNWNAAGQSVANMAVVPLDILGRMAAYANVGTDLIIDCIGYYR